MILLSEKTSAYTGFYKLTPQDRLKFVADYAQLTPEEAQLIQNTGSLKLEQADHMVENVIGMLPVPMGVAVNFQINGHDYLIPMAIEEPSVIAAASNMAKLARETGGFQVTYMGSVMIGQIQAIKVPDPYAAKMRIYENEKRILEKADEQDPILVKFGGGARGLRVKVLNSLTGPMVITELLVDCKDAMGANAVNTMSEAVAPIIEEVTGGKVLLRIISNLATQRLARARTKIKQEALGGEEVVDAIIDAYAFAAADPYRCSTHNKGIMNGVIAAALACGQDTRALEAGAHSYAARNGHYEPLTTWEKNEEGDLVGTLEMPMAVGLVGGAVASNPIAKLSIKILGVKTAAELAQILCAVGLAQNLAALKALATEGIQRGHMGLHARNVAIAAGATGDLVDKVAEAMVKERKVRADRAKELLAELSN